MQGCAQFAAIGGGDEGHVGQGQQVGQVEYPVMGRSVGPYDSGAVYQQAYRKVLQGDVVDDLVVGALQESGVHYHKRSKSPASHAGGQSQGVGFGNAGVDDPGGVFGAQDGQSAGGRHGRGEGVERFVLAGQMQEFLPDDVLIAYPGGVFQEAGGAVEVAGVVVEDLFGFGRGKSFPFDGGYVQQFYAG